MDACFGSVGVVQLGSCSRSGFLGPFAGGLLGCGEVARSRIKVADARGAHRGGAELTNGGCIESHSIWTIAASQFLASTMAVGHNGNLQQNVDVLGIECIERMEMGLGLDWAFGAEMESLLPSGERNGFVVTTCWWVVVGPTRAEWWECWGLETPCQSWSSIVSHLGKERNGINWLCVYGVEPSYPMRESEKLDTCCSSRKPKP